MTLWQAWAVLRTVPPDVARAVGEELGIGRPLEAHRVLTVALGDGRQAKAVIAAIIRWQLTGHAE